MRYLFKHVLMRDTAYEMQMRRHLRQMHRRAAEAIKMHYADLVSHYTDLAYHYRQAELKEHERHYAKLSGEQAAARFANERAVTFFSRALELTSQEDVSECYTILLAREKVYDLQGVREFQAQDLAALEILAGVLDDDQERAEVALRQANYAEATGDYAAAVLAAQVAVELAQAAQDVRRETIGYLYWGRTLWRQGNYEAARTWLGRSLVRIRGAQTESSDSERKLNRAVEADIFRNLGSVSYYLCDYADARICFERALSIFGEIGDRRGESSSFSTLALVSLYQGDYVEAKAYFEQVLVGYREIGYRRGEGNTLANLGAVSTHLGDYVAARAYLEKALLIAREIDDQMGEGWTLSYLGLLFHCLGNDEAAHQHSQRALIIAQEIGDRSDEGDALTYLGHASVGLGRMAEAANAYRQAMTLRRELGQMNPAMESLAGLVRASLLQGDLAQAQLHVEEILRHLGPDTLGGMEEPFRVYLTCYQTLAAVGDPRAVEILDTAHSLLQERAARIPDDAVRRSFLENVLYHRQIVAEWGSR